MRFAAQQGRRELPDDVTRLVRQSDLRSTPGRNGALLQQERSLGLGRPLDAPLRRQMEDRFEYSFGDVRIHTGSTAARAAESVGAKAFTAGSHIVFNNNTYNPGTGSGQSLIAHELAHVVQHQAPGSRIDTNATVSSGLQEQQADAAPGADLQAQAAHPPIARAVKTWAGEFDTRKYDLVSGGGLRGVEIDLRFKPGRHVDAELVGMLQTVRSTQGGTPVPGATFTSNEADRKAYESERIPPCETGAGTKIDQLARFRNPLYATGTTGAADTLATTATSASWGQHGWRYTDSTGAVKKQDAQLMDQAMLSERITEGEQVFESAALAVKGNQQGTYYGSVRWGWSAKADGTVEKKPLSMVSTDAPTDTFKNAAEKWNAAKTGAGEETMDLPHASMKFTNAAGAWLVGEPTAEKSSLIGTLGRNTRVAVIDEGSSQAFNQTSGSTRWWKVTVVAGNHVGKVGWIKSRQLADTRSKAP